MSNEVNHGNMSTVGQLQTQLQLVAEARIVELEDLRGSAHREIGSYLQKAEYLSYEVRKAEVTARIGSMIAKWALDQTISLESGHYSAASNSLAGYLEGRDIRQEPFEHNGQLHGTVIRAYGLIMTLGYSQKWESRHQDQPFTRFYTESVSCIHN